MKKSLFISVFALLVSVSVFAQEPEKKAPEFKVPSVEEVAKRRADMMRQQYLLGKDQYDKVYKLCLKQAKKDAARMEEMKKEREQMNKEMQGILNDAQWEKYEKMQKFPHFRPGKHQMRRPMPMRPGVCPDGKKKEAAPQFKPGEMVKGPKIEQPQGRKNNMILEQKAE